MYLVSQVEYFVIFKFFLEIKYTRNCKKLPVYHGWFINVMFFRSTNRFLPYTLVFAYISRSVSTILLKVSSVFSQCFSCFICQILRVIKFLLWIVSFRRLSWLIWSGGIMVLWTNGIMRNNKVIEDTLKKKKKRNGNTMVILWEICIKHFVSIVSKETVHWK